MSTLFTSSIATTTAAIPSSQPPRPQPSSTNHDDDDDSDDEDEGHHDDSHEASSTWSGWPTSTVDLPQTTTPSVGLSQTTSMLPVSTTSSTLPSTKTSANSATSSESVAAARPTAQTFGSDSTPNNIADPGLEAKASSSPLNTAGIVLAAVFGLIALVTIFYLLYRLTCRRKTYAASRRTDGTILEKGFVTSWPSVVQETGVIFEPRSTRSQPKQNQQHGRFSLLHRTWYSSGTPSTTRNSSSASASTTPFPWPLSFFNTGLGLRTSWARSNRSATTEVLNGQYIDDPALNRNISQRSMGSGHARAYAHHNVGPPASPAPARSRISVLSSRLLRRRRASTESREGASRDAEVETSQMYDSSSLGSPGITEGRSSPLSVLQESRRGNSQGTRMPRLPLPVAVGTGQISRS